MDRAPCAASTRDPGPEPDRAGSFNLEDAEDPTRFPMSPGDERARRARLAVPPTPKPEVTGEERDHLVAACAQGVAAWSGVYGASDVLVHALSDLLGIGVEEAERLIDAEIRRGTAGKE